MPAVAEAKREATLESISKCIRVCVKCPLHESRTLAVPGEGTPGARFMIIGEGPGKDEDRTGHPFVGSAGAYLDHVLEGTGIERADFFITNIIKCRPPNNRTPRAIEVLTCTSNYLFKQIELVDPELIILLGLTAVKKMLNLKSVDEARGKIIESNGRRFMASYHPAARFYREDLSKKIKADFAKIKAELVRLSK
ncbi:MAG TPA: uracil-DNA glycosylase [Verrucomicrobiae bacterium]